MKREANIFVGRKLTSPETRYSKHKNIKLALVYAARILDPYFQGRLVRVYMEYPIRKILAKAKETGRLAK